MSSIMEFEKDQLKSAYAYWIDFTIKQMRMHSEQRFREAGLEITIDQWLVLKCISEQDRASQKDVAQIVAKDAASITRILDILGKRGWVKRMPNDTDRRKHDLVLTAAGKKYIRKVFPLVKELRAEGVKGVTNKELKALKQTLEKIRKNVT